MLAVMAEKIKESSELPQHKVGATSDNTNNKKVGHVREMKHENAAL